MATEQYHEPTSELSDSTRDFARVITSLIEEAEAISWYEQRIQATGDEEVKKVVAHAQEEEMEHFSIALEWLIRKKPEWKEILQAILFKEGDIIENAKKWEEE